MPVKLYQMAECFLMFSRRLSSALYPTQLHRRNVCIHMRALNSIDTIISTYAASLMVAARPVHDPLREELRMRLSASHKDSWNCCGEAPREPDRVTAPSLHTRHQSLLSPPLILLSSHFIPHIVLPVRNPPHDIFYMLPKLCHTSCISSLFLFHHFY